MNCRIFSFLSIVTAILFFLAAPCLAAEAAQWGRAEYWTGRYGSLPVHSPEYQMAERVFRAVLAAADRKAGVDPRLVVLERRGGPWAQALNDGSVVLTRDAIDTCYRTGDEESGDARLAFILGHEIAHLMNGDFWHSRFFMAAESAGVEDAGRKKALDEVKDIIRDSDNFKAKEIEADQLGIIYASMAGFKIDAIISREMNFFAEWASAIDPTGVRADSSHPTPLQRGASISVGLRQVHDDLDLFRLGVIYLSIGRYDDASALLEEFKRLYPGKEVYTNLGVAHLLKAYRAYQAWKGEFRYRLSIAVDPVTTAEGSMKTRGTTVRSSIDRGVEYRSEIRSAIRYLKEAVDRDPGYPVSRSNLGVAYLLEGEASTALGLFDEAVRLSPDDPGVLNNRGVAYIMLGEELGTDLSSKALSDWKRAAGAGGSGRAAFRNLAVLTGSLEKAGLERTGGKSPGGALEIHGLRPGMPLSLGMLEEKFGRGVRRSLVPTGAEMVRYYREGLTVVMRKNRLDLLVSSEGGGSSVLPEILAVGYERLGRPSRVHPTPTGSIAVYPDRGVALREDGGRITSVVLFDPDAGGM